MSMEKSWGKQENPFIEQEQNRSIRVKVTDKCPWECSFCHAEGGDGILDMDWNEKFQENIELLKEKMDIREIHYTGGEPTQNANLDKLTMGLRSLGLDVKTTSNAQFSEKRMDELIASGLESFNFSVHSLNADKFLETQKRQDKGWAEKSIEKQKEMIKKALEKGADVKLNTVLSTEEDIEKAMEIYAFAKENGVNIRFLNDLGGGEEAENAIEKMVQKNIGAKKFKEKVISGSSSETSYYRDESGFEFGVKEIREQKLESLCDGCQENCTEQFYGVRLEEREDGFYVRLCLERDDEKSVMPLEDFLESTQLQEINQLINQ